jgi:hypothetical protein
VQIGFVASLAQSMLVLHSTQAPFVPQTGVAALRIEHACAGALEHGSHLFATQNDFVASAVQFASAVHSTHLPLVPSHTPVGALHAPAPAAWHPLHTPATQKAREASRQCIAASVHCTQAPAGLQTGLVASFMEQA